ncbi:hypothetical protein FJZ36_00660 [Candidatus Poribacteria bacterium]|nr:hypothetical protein [Candidatus Poribacteria bacterium]
MNADVIRKLPSTPRVESLRRRVRDAMEQPPAEFRCPPRIDEAHMSEPLAVRKALAICAKLEAMPTDLWDDQLIAGSMTLENPRIHAERGFPDYVTPEEKAAASSRGLSIHSVFGHIVPDYPRLLGRGLRAIAEDARRQATSARTQDELAFLRSVEIACDAVCDFADRLSQRCDSEAERADLTLERRVELRTMAANLRQVPSEPAQTFWQALQSVWLLHMIFHSTMNGNAVGRLDQYAAPYLETDLTQGTIDLGFGAELVDCFTLKFNERAKTTDDQRPEAREDEPKGPSSKTRHDTSSQRGTRRDSVDATNHWLQNIIVGGVTPNGDDGTNPLTFLLLESYRRNRMTNPLLTVRVHRRSPEELIRASCEVLKDGGGMPAFFNDEALVPALMRIGIDQPDARDYTNDGCWEVIIPGRTDFRFQRLSLMLCLERALNRGNHRRGEGDPPPGTHGPDPGDPRRFSSFDDVWQAFEEQIDAMVGYVVQRVASTVDNRSTIAPVPLLSALIEGAVESRRDLTAGGARYRTFGMLAESASHAIDSLTAIRQTVFERREASMTELCDALDVDFEGWGPLRAKLIAAPKYGNDDPVADAMGRQVIDAFTNAVARHAVSHASLIRFPCGVGTFSWYIGIGEGLGASPDGRRSGEPVASNFSPALGRDAAGLTAAILSYSKMHHENLPAGGPIDLRVARHLVAGEEGTTRMSGLVRGFVDAGGAMMTLTVADTEELRAAQRDPDRYRSLRVRMGGWCAYFTMLSREQQDHHIRRQEGRS